jgi:hypothetical protein
VNYDALVEQLDTSHGLMTKMYSKKLVTTRQKEFIEMTESTFVSNERLLDVVRRGTESDFDGFLECLRETGQTHVCDVLGRDGVVVHLVATSVEGADIRQEEAQIVQRFMNLLRSASKEDKERLCREVSDVMNERGDVELIALNTRNSIGLFLFCTTLSGFCYIHERYVCGQLKNDVEALFKILKRDQSTVIRVKTLTWKTPTYTSGAEYFLRLLDLPILADLYHGERQIEAACLQRGNDLSIAMDLPLEIVELIVTKAAGQLFVLANRSSARAGVIAHVTLCAVSLLWRRLMTCRMHNRKLLRRFFELVSRPFKYNCQQSYCIPVAGGGDGSVSGVAELCGRLYVVCECSDVIRVFNNRPPFNRLEDVQVQDLNHPQDIAACHDTSQLFVADCSRRRLIWRVSPCDKHVEEFIKTLFMPWSLSVKNSRLLITPYDGDVLMLYDSDGMRVSSVELPRYMLALHAVETTHGTFIVSHQSTLMGDRQPEHNSVSEVDIRGRVIQIFDRQRNIAGGLQFNSPYHLALDGFGHVIVADRLNKRIVVLQSDLKLKQVLTASLDGQPIRLSLSQDSGSLVVSCSCSNTLTVFQVYQI